MLSDAAEQQTLLVSHKSQKSLIIKITEHYTNKQFELLNPHSYSLLNNYSRLLELRYYLCEQVTQLAVNFIITYSGIYLHLKHYHCCVFLQKLASQRNT